MRLLNLAGYVFGRLTVQRRLASRKKKVRWLCLCSCGTTVEVSAGELRSGQTKSCGCLQRERTSGARKIHGESLIERRTVEYTTWLNLRARASNKRSPRYKDYGGRGVTVDERWDSYENFLSDMGRRPSSRHTIERIDNNKGYSPSNCKWATMAEQNSNKRSNRIIEHGGLTMNVAQWEKFLGYPRGAVNIRLHKGWNETRALTQPLRKHPNQRI